MFNEEQEIADRYRQAVLAAEAAGKVLMSYFGRPMEIRKKGLIDLVTEADLAAEKEIVDRLGAAFPGDCFYTEETRRDPAESADLWVIDPLDGTTNFSHGYPFFCVSIALRRRGRETLGVVLAPAFGELFTACRGRGAFLNGNPIRCSSTGSLRESLLVTGFAYDIALHSDGVLRRFRNVLLRSQAVRRDGSAALDLCYVAAGRFDGFWEEHLKPWDTAAARVVAEEAGGRVTTFSGGPFDIFGKEILASNGRIHGELLDALNIPREG
ncbi:MAG: inositol monophosphatase [Acidobacteria bacterium]|nr:inositol monophosphatase [Acidobacteriota bacterium]